ncbi:MAG: hypothetical protein JXR77_18720 [Lentisphaeria bacterium]|nr:hypothetical protein [Lentisphaeria bacterium]
MPREVLESYLSRSITMMDLCTGRKDAGDDLRMLRALGAKFAGRTLYLWGGESDLPRKLAAARTVAAQAHEADPELILQAGIFEIVTTQVGSLAVPDWLFAAFGAPAEDRNFRYAAMLFDGGRYHNHWRQGASVPDMSKLETRMWFTFLARQYIDAGMEAIHFGQVALVGAADRDFAGWRDVLGRVRAHASRHARRHVVLCDAHTPCGGPRFENRLLFDFHSFPLRIREVAGTPQEGMLEMGYLDSLFGRSRGGITPSGWECASLPYLVEFDNWGSSGKGGQGGRPYWTWGYDEICWFAHQPEAYRNAWLRYAWRWVREHDVNGFLQMPGSRCLADPVDGLRWYEANTRSPACPNGFGQEETIRAIWAEDR